MKRKRVFFIAGLVSVTLVSGLLINNISAAGVQPGSSSDPLVSKSYVDDKINQALGTAGSGSVSVSGTLSSTDREAIVKEVLAQVNNSETGVAPTMPYSGSSGVMDQFSPVSIASGQILIGYEGTEIILRSGKVTGHCQGENGLVNITEGKEIGNGSEIKPNHLIIVPRYESRGVKASETSWLMVKGGFEILN